MGPPSTQTKLWTLLPKELHYQIDLVKIVKLHSIEQSLYCVSDYITAVGKKIGPSVLYSYNKVTERKATCPYTEDFCETGP